MPMDNLISFLLGPVDPFIFLGLMAVIFAGAFGLKANTRNVSELL